jgi:hypothetical protein
MQSTEQDTILFIVSTALSILLIISEVLGMSKCDANSILQLLGKIQFKGCKGQHDQVSPPPSLSTNQEE